MYNYKIMIDKQPSLDTSLIHRRGGRLLKLILMAVSGGVCAQTSAAGAFLCTIIDASEWESRERVYRNTC